MIIQSRNIFIMETELQKQNIKSTSGYDKHSQMQIYICQIYCYKQYSVLLISEIWTCLSLGYAPTAFKRLIFDM